MATVIVYVANVNDEFPVFATGTDHMYASISEEQTIGTVVTIIQATDPDGDNVKYYFTRKPCSCSILNLYIVYIRICIYMCVCVQN